MSLTNSQINAILKEYDNKQFRNRARLDEKINKIRRELPEYRIIDDELISSSASFAKRALLEGDSFNIDEAISYNNLLTSKKKHILTSAGYPDNYLEMEYDCPKCQDTGYINNEPCACFKQAAIRLLYSQALINTAITTQNFDTFDYSMYSKTKVDPNLNVTPYENIVKVVEVCKNFIDELDQSPENRSIKNLLLTGNPGVGKTFLSNCIAKATLDKALSVVYITAGELFEVLEKASFKKDYDNDEEDASLENIDQCDLLIIDDLGTEFMNRFTNSKLYSCINDRLLKNLPIIISTNLNYRDLRDAYSERIYSRLVGDFTTLIIIGDDIRIKKS